MIKMAFFIIIFDQFLSLSQLKIGTHSITFEIPPPLNGITLLSLDRFLIHKKNRNPSL